MFSIFTYIMSRVTHSEPGLPMVLQCNWRIVTVLQKAELYYVQYRLSILSALKNSEWTRTMIALCQNVRRDNDNL